MPYQAVERCVRLVCSVVVLAAMFALAACTGGDGGGSDGNAAVASSGGGGGGAIGGGGGSSAEGPTGTVSLSISDAPIDNFSSFEIDVVQATLFNPRTSQTAYLYNGIEFNNRSLSRTYTPKTLNLLSQQGFAALVGGASVPVGTYGVLNIIYSAVRALNTNGAQQTVNILDPREYNWSLGRDTYTASLRLKPELGVTEGATQSVALDFDLANSLTATNDANTWNLSLAMAPTPSARPVPISEFIARVSTQLVLDTMSITVAVKDPETGDISDNDVKIVLSDTIIHHRPKSFSGSTAGVGVALGKLTHETVAARISYLKEQAASVRSSGWAQLANVYEGEVFNLFPVGGQFKVEGSLVNGVIAASDITNYTPGSNVADVRGTIMDSDTDAGTITVAVDRATGGDVHIDYLEEIVISVTDETAMRRGSTTLVLADLSPYNYCNITATADFFENLTATGISMVPSYVAGTATNFSEDTGENGGDVITFTPDTVNLFRGDMLANDLDLLPDTLNFEVFDETVEAGDKVKVMGFFSRSGTGGVARIIRTYDYKGAVGLRGVNTDSGAESRFRIRWNPIPDGEAADDGYLFQIVPADVSGDAGVTVSTFIPNDGFLVFTVNAQSEITKITGFDVISALGQTWAAGEMVGKPDDDGVFNATAFYFLASDTVSLSTDGTFTFTGVAAADTEAEATETSLSFTLDTGDGKTVTINATDAARVRVFDEQNKPTNLSLEDAADLINGGGVEEIEVVSLKDKKSDIVSNVLSISLTDHPDGMLAKPGNVVKTGTVSSEADITVADNGAINFGLTDDGGTLVAATITPAANVLLIDRDGNGAELERALVVSVLQGKPFSVELEGTASGRATSFTADVAARIKANPNASRTADYGNTLKGKFSIDGGVDTNFVDGFTSFKMSVIGPGGTQAVVKIKVPAAAKVELNTNGAIEELVFADYDIPGPLASNPNAVLEATGSIAFTGGATFEANVSLCICVGEGAPSSYTVTGTRTSDSAGHYVTGDLIAPIDVNGTTYYVEIPSSGVELFIRTPDGNEVSVTDGQAAEALNAAVPPLVIAEGSAPATAGNSFRADKRVTICKNFATAPEVTSITGTRAESSTAALNASGLIEFELAAADADGVQTEITVFVATGAKLELATAEGNTQTLSANAVVDALNTLDASVTVNGSAAPTASGFSADVLLRINVKPEVADRLTGVAVSTASQETDGDVVFQLNAGEAGELEVTVEALAVIRAFRSNGGIDTLTAPDLVQLINVGMGEDSIEVGGTRNDTRFRADYIDVHKPAPVPSGATINGNIVGTAELDGSDIVFTMAFYDWTTQASGEIDVTVTSGAGYILVNGETRTSVTAEEAVDALNDSPIVVVVKGSADYEGGSYEADVELQVYADSGQFGANSHTGTLAEGSTATVNGDGDVEFNLSVAGNDGTVFSIGVTIDVGAAYVEYIDEFFESTELTDAATIAAKINNDASGIYVESTSGQTGDTFLADSKVTLSKVDTGGGGDIGGFVAGMMTPMTEASVNAAGNLELSLDTENPMGGILTVAVTVAAAAEFKLVDISGNETPLADADEMAAALNDAGAFGFIFAGGSLPYAGQTEYFADTSISVTLGAGADFFYKGTVNTSGNAPMFDGTNVVFVLDVYDGSEGPLNPVQTVTVSVNPAAFIQSFTQTGGFAVQMDPNTIAGLLDAAPFEVEVKGSTMLEPGGSTYAVDATGYLVIYVDQLPGTGPGTGSATDTVWGIASSPTLNGDILTFFLNVTEQTTPGAPPFGNTVIATVDISLMTSFYQPNAGGPIGPLLADAALAYLNGGPLLVELVGVYNSVDGTFMCVQADPPTSMIIHE